MTFLRKSVFIFASNTKNSLWEFKAHKSIRQTFNFPYNVTSSEKQ